MKSKLQGIVDEGVSRRQVIQGVAAAAVVAGAGTKLLAHDTPTAPPPPHEPHQDVFKLLTFWLAATNGNSALNALDDPTLYKMGFSATDITLLGKARKHVYQHPTLYTIIREEFQEVANLYNNYQPGECPQYPDTLKLAEGLTAP